MDTSERNMTLIGPDGTETPSFSLDDMKAATKALSGKAPMKNTEADQKVLNDAYSVTATQLRSLVQRYERLAADKADIADDQKEVMAEAKSLGYDTKALRRIIAMRREDPDKRAELEAVVDMYRTALGM
ncbi:DUF2312 domain-containing protein [Roseicyclus sp.]|uniref:DUF2312 domain-containing protein n=1 Tax=Roseicyclus sp. TaxID=1914329 RepID=UPI003F6CE235